MLNRNKRIGIIVMAGAFVAMPLTFAMSDCTYCSPSWSANIMYGMRILLGDDDWVFTKYVLCAFLALFALGLLFYVEALSAPFGPLVSESKGTEGTSSGTESKTTTTAD